MPRRQFFIHIYQRIPHKSVNNKAMLSNTIAKTKFKKDSNTLLQYNSYVEKIPFLFFEPFESLILKCCTKQCSCLKPF